MINVFLNFFRRIRVVLGVALPVLCLLGSIPVSAAQPIVVASKIDGEGALLGNMLVLILEANKIPVTNKVQLGVTKVVREALLSGQIDIYPEYTGNGAFMLGDENNPAWKNLKEGYELVRQKDYEKNKLVWLTPASANNTWAIAVRQDIAASHQLKSMDDLARALNAGLMFKIAGGAEFFERRDALPSFERQYGFKLKQSQFLSFPGNDTSAFIKAAAERTSGVNAAVVYGTDGAVSSLGLVVLQDPKGAQPVYAPTPVIREEVLKRYPQVESLLKPVFSALDTPTLQKLNGDIGIQGKEPRAVASAWLKSQKLIK